MEPWRRKSLAAVTALGLLVAVLALKGSVTGDQGKLSDLHGKDTVEAVFINDGKRAASLTLEVADSEAERRRGLMNRTSLEPGTGMLFIWNSSSERAFWMKNTYIPLDMIFITEEGVVRSVKEAEPQPNTSMEELKVYRSGGPARYVVETKQGFSQENSIGNGTRVLLEISH